MAMNCQWPSPGRTEIHISMTKPSTYTHIHLYTNRRSGSYWYLCFHTICVESAWWTGLLRSASLSADSVLKVKEKHSAPLLSEHNSAKWLKEGKENKTILKWCDRSKKRGKVPQSSGRKRKWKYRETKRTNCVTVTSETCWSFLTWYFIQGIRYDPSLYTIYS